MKEKLSLLHQVGQRLAIGVHGTTVDDSFKRLVETYKIANVVLFADNIIDKVQFKSLCEEIQGLVKEETGYPAFITLDQEGGVVTRLPDDCTNMPGAMAIAATGNPELARLAGEITGKELKALGVNFNLAPVLDINSNPNNPAIGVRSFGDTAATVSKYAIPMFRGMVGEDILAVGKHFPGHGDTSVDSHLELPVVDKPLEMLWEVELRSFDDAIKADIPAIMSSHIRFPALEPDDLPATMSRRILTDFLRGTMGFKGLVLTDCLEMKAIQTKYGTVEGVLAAAHAGADLCMISKNHTLSEEAALAMIKALEEGRLDKTEMEASVHRILSYKKAYGKKEAPSLDIVGSTAHREAATDIMEKTITAVNLPKGKVYDLGKNPLFLGCLSYRSTIASSPADERFNFVRSMEELLGGSGILTPLNPTEEEIEEIIRNIDYPTSITLGTYNGHIATGQLALAKRLSELTIPLTVVACRNPYDLKPMPSHVATIAAYEYTNLAFKAVAKVLKGLLTPTGVLRSKL